ncbi:MAG: branched-chain amino acid ABC transporter permease [Halobacteriota archaeon]
MWLHLAVPTLERVLEVTANGVVYSSIIVLGAIGLSLVYSIANFANFAHGDTMTVGAYGALVAFGITGSIGVSILGLPLGFFVALVVGIVTAAVVALATERIVYRPLEVGRLGLLITSIGLAFVYRGLIQLYFGADVHRYDIPSLPPIDWLVEYGIRINSHDVTIVITAASLVASLHVLLQYTDFGRKMRAMADNPNLARVSGIRTRRVLLATWAIGAGLAGAAGVFLGLYNQLVPRMGFNVLLVVFAAVILGGIGSVYGAMLGGFLIGMIVQMTPLLGAFGLPIGSEYAEALAFLVMVAVLLVRPSGIAGQVIDQGGG